MPCVCISCLILVQAAAKKATIWLTSTLRREREGGYMRAQHPAEHSSVIVPRCPDDHVLGEHMQALLTSWVCKKMHQTNFGNCFQRLDGHSIRKREQTRQKHDCCHLISFFPSCFQCIGVWYCKLLGCHNCWGVITIVPACDMVTCSQQSFHWWRWNVCLHNKVKLHELICTSRLCSILCTGSCRGWGNVWGSSG